MCGIVLVSESGLTPSLLEEKTKKMLETLRHRGPDGRRTWVHGTQPVALGHARLSIIDLEAGWQPMVDEASGCAMVFNGEIYNYRELRKGLENEGAVFRTSSDSEVLLKAWVHWREGALVRLN